MWYGIKQHLHISVPIDIAPGIDPIDPGATTVANMESGMMSPPLELDPFVTLGIGKIVLSDLVRAALP